MTSRRHYLAAGATVLALFAGCTGDSTGSAEAEQRSFELTVTRSDGSLASSLTPTAETRDVVTVSVGETITFEIRNRTPDAVGFHDHATGAEFTIPSDGDRTWELAPTASAVGRHTVEAYTIPGTDERGDTETHAGGEDHGHDHDDGHSHGTANAEENSHHGSARTTADHHRSDTATVLTVAVRPRE
ncbi:hypothetical protein [Haloplanus sp.]|uniref:hypothetical protein n=1 Tax=Haloplanus sp. TaxID=1961696 RepID=UPI002606519C|nr:hypothetical protein [Haloplanus sp.]